MPVVNRQHIDIHVAETSGAKSQNEEWLSSDILFNGEDHDILRITYAVDAAAKIQFTFNSGSNWYILKEKTSVNADDLIISYIPIRSNDQINFKTDEVGGVTVDFFRADFVEFESGAVGAT